MIRIQSVLFDKHFYNVHTAVVWLKRHRYVHNKVDIRKNYLRFRQFDPLLNKQYRIIEFSPIIKAVVEI